MKYVVVWLNLTKCTKLRWISKKIRWNFRTSLLWKIKNIYYIKLAILFIHLWIWKFKPHHSTKPSKNPKAISLYLGNGADWKKEAIVPRRFLPRWNLPKKETTSTKEVPYFWGDTPQRSLLLRGENVLYALIKISRFSLAFFHVKIPEHVGNFHGSRETNCAVHT